MNKENNIYRGIDIHNKEIVYGELIEKSDEEGSPIFKLQEGDIIHQVSKISKQSPFKWKGNIIYENDYLHLKICNTIIISDVWYKEIDDVWVAVFIYNEITYEIPLMLLFNDVDSITNYINFYDLPF